MQFTCRLAPARPLPGQRSGLRQLPGLPGNPNKTLRLEIGTRQFRTPLQPPRSIRLWLTGSRCHHYKSALHATTERKRYERLTSRAVVRWNGSLRAADLTYEPIPADEGRGPAVPGRRAGRDSVVEDHRRRRTLPRRHVVDHLVRDCPPPRSTVPRISVTPPRLPPRARPPEPRSPRTRMAGRVVMAARYRGDANAWLAQLARPNPYNAPRKGRPHSPSRQNGLPHASPGPTIALSVSFLVVEAQKK